MKLTEKRKLLEYDWEGENVKKKKKKQDMIGGKDWSEASDRKYKTNSSRTE